MVKVIVFACGTQRIVEYFAVGRRSQTAARGTSLSKRAAASYALVLQWIRDRVCEAGLPTRDSHRSIIPNYSDHTTLMQDVNRS